MSSVARGRSAWLAPLLLFLAVLLTVGLAFNLANLDTGGEALPAPPSSGGTSTAPNSFEFASFSIYIVAAFGILIILVSVDAWRHRKRLRPDVPRRPSSFWQFIQTMIGVGLFIAMVVLFPGIAQKIQLNRGGGSNTTSGGTSAANGPMQVFQGVAGVPLGVFLAAALLAGILILFYLQRVRVSGESAAERRLLGPDRSVAAVAVQATIQDLEVGKDVRTTILACYQRFCRLLGRRGIIAQEPLTPREIQGLAVDRLGVAEERAEALTSLFEEARYSVHELGEPERERALASLQSLRADLEA